MLANYISEPLAVNAFETVKGIMRMKANGMRSYDITAELVSGNQSLLTDGQLDFDYMFDTRRADDGFTRRTGKWALHEQTYYFGNFITHNF